MGSTSVANADRMAEHASDSAHERWMIQKRNELHNSVFWNTEVQLRSLLMCLLCCVRAQTCQDCFQGLRQDIATVLLVRFASACTILFTYVPSMGCAFPQS